MAAGAVSAPRIIPIMHLKTHRANDHIRTNTPVSLQSDTPGVQIFFTLDGRWPVQDHRVSVSSRKYTTPVLLPAGRVTVKAVAVHRDGRQSSTVTKAFSVQLIEEIQDHENFLQGDQQVQCSVSCHPVVPDSVVPENTHSCLICEAPTHSQPQVCVCCGSGNPVDTLSCLTCESQLQRVCVAHSATSVPSAGNRKWSCSRCERSNQSDARFCDWCGLKASHVADVVVCWRCGARGHPYPLDCPACSLLLEAPPTSSSNTTQPAGGDTSEQASGNLSHDATLQKTKMAAPTREQSTDTAGLFYPSATALQQREQQRALQLSRRRESRERQLSAGRKKVEALDLPDQ